MNHEEYLKQQRKRNRQIVKQREQGKTFKEIGELHGISPQRAEQIYKKSVV